MNLTAVPDGHTYLLDCDERGPLGVVDRTVLHHAAYLHLLDHGIEAPMTPNCECGYDYARVTGHLKDHATCTTCTWESYGLFADHQAHHHYLTTQHPWALKMGDRP